jgi:hypothetical protein
MDAEEMVLDGSQTDRRAQPGPDPRSLAQRRMDRAAQIAFGISVLDCALLETSRSGASIQLLAHAEVPKTVTLRLRSGESWTVEQRWRKGLQIGFKVTGILPY